MLLRAQRWKGEGACLVLGQRSLRGYSWQLRTTADIRLRFALQKFGKAEIRMSAERCPKLRATELGKDKRKGKP